MTVDLTKQLRSVPKPAGRRQQLGLPLPAGQLIRPNMVTPEERAVLESSGWKDGDPVPANLADILSQVQDSATNLDRLPLPLPANTPPAEYTEKDIADLPPEEQARLKQVLLSVLTGAKHLATDAKEFAKFTGHDPSVLAAAKLAGQVPVVNDLDSDSYDAGAAKTPAAPPQQEDTPAAGPTNERCTRCGFPRDQKDVIEVTEVDKDLFLESILGGKQFCKTVELYNGKIKLLIRTLTPKEHDACWRQVTLDWGTGRVKNLIDQGEMLTRYRTVLQLVSVDGLDRPVYLPNGMQEWEKLIPKSDKHTFLVEALDSLENTLVSESLNRMVTGSVSDFNMLVTKMEANAVNPDF